MESYIVSKEAVLFPSTIRGYRNIQRILKEYSTAFYDIKISDIEQPDVQNVISDLSKTKSPKTVRNYHGLYLRHYSASIRHALRIPDAYIMADGGWSSDKVLKSVYRHVMSDRKKEMSDRTNSHFGELYNTKCNTKLKNTANCGVF